MSQRELFEDSQFHNPTVKVPLDLYSRMASALYRLNQAQAWLRHPTDNDRERLRQMQDLLTGPCTLCGPA